MAAEITALLSKGVIEPTADHPRLYLSPIFLGDFSLDPQPQEDQSLHRVSTFQNGDASVYTSLPEPWRLDYLHRSLRHISHVPIAAASRDLLGFTFNGSVYRFRALPFGLMQARTSPIHEASRLRGRFPPSAGVAKCFATSTTG